MRDNLLTPADSPIRNTDIFMEGACVGTEIVIFGVNGNRAGEEAALAASPDGWNTEGTGQRS
ncbi:hypothetical protein MCNS_45720 [Mycobacterium conspicuum]|uniref:Uncharacterized protein n=1 Tax=Mycobacterium conspicuum TaxID=44010 RepID=A0A7I7YIM0_9MYCO|nr:hypothetical protein MCNS_45720 [Mycobacterium conspicuum]